VRARRELRFTLCVLLSATAIIGMLPAMQAFAANPATNDFDSNLDYVLALDGLISKLLGGDNDEDDDDEDGDDKGQDHDSKKDRPKAHDQSVEMEEDSSIRIELEASADRDDPITFAIVEEPENGKLLEFNASGSVTYEPEANFYGSDSFTFTASDGDEESQPATVTIQVSSINDLPVAFSSSITTREGKSVSFELRGTDIETEDLQYVIVSEPSHGKLDGTAPSLTYRPDNRFDGSDELAFKVSDGTSDSELATVKIKVKEKDKESDESDRWWEKTPVTAQSAEPSSAAVAVTGNDTEDAPGPIEPEQVTVIAQPIPTIAESPIISTVLNSNEIAEAPIKDLVAPQIIVPVLLNVIATSKDGAIVNFDAKAIDDTDGEIPVTCSPGPGSMVPIGTFNIVCEATDAAGNSALNSFMVAVSPATAVNIATSSISFLVPALLAVLGVGAGAYFRFKPVRKQRKSAV
jgi:Big-like domain-containing protein/HYR domain-containing protein